MAFVFPGVSVEKTPYFSAALRSFSATLRVVLFLQLPALCGFTQAT